MASDKMFVCQSNGLLRDVGGCVTQVHLEFVTGDLLVKIRRMYRFSLAPDSQLCSCRKMGLS